jgi:hypothetical protein
MIIDEAPKLLSIFVYKLQIAENAVSLPEINNWVKEQVSKISMNEVRSLMGFI